MNRQEFIKKGEDYVDKKGRFYGCSVKVEQFLYDFKTYREDYKHYSVYNCFVHNIFLNDITNIFSDYCFISRLYFNIFDSTAGNINCSITKEYIEKLNKYYND